MNHVARTAQSRRPLGYTGRPRRYHHGDYNRLPYEGLSVKIKKKIKLILVYLFFTYLLVMTVINMPNFENPFSCEYQSREDRLFAEHHSLSDFNDPNFFRDFFFPGCPNCPNMTEYMIWRLDHSN